MIFISVSSYGSIKKAQESPDPSVTEKTSVQQDTTSSATRAKIRKEYTSDAKKQKLKIRGMNDFPPFSYLNKEGKPDGFDVDIIKAILEDLGYKPGDYEYQLESFDELKADIKESDIDIIGGVFYSFSNAEDINLSLPLCTLSHNIIIPDNSNITNLWGLKNKKVIVQDGSFGYRFLIENKLTNTIFMVKTLKEGINLLKRGGADAIITSDLAFFNSKINLHDFNLKIIGLGTSPQHYAIATPANNRVLMYKLNIGLQNLKSSGQYNAIYSKWFGIKDKSVSLIQYLIIFGVVTFFVLILLLFIWLLRRKVNKATNQIMLSQQELELAINAGEITAWSYDTTKQEFIALRGQISKTDAIGSSNFFSLLHPDDIERMRKNFRDLSINAQNNLYCKFRMRKERTDTEYRIFETRMIYVPGQKKIVGTLKDITEDILMREKLEDFKIKSEFITNMNGVILFNYDALEMEFFRLNPGNSEIILSYPQDEYLNLVHPDDREIAIKFMEDLSIGENSNISSEYRMINDDGSYDWYAIEAVAYKRNELGTIVNYLGLRRNNTKWKNITDDLIVLRDRAEASNRLKSAFLANMSHEIRTPLNAIIGFSELITETTDKEEQEHYKSIINTNNHLLLQLINDVLDLSKIEAGYVDFKFEGFNFHTFFNDLYQSLSMRKPENISFINAAPNLDLDILGDKMRITQLITNFVTNAFKFTSKGSVTMSYSFNNEELTVEISDTGIGIAPENQEKIFDRFEKLNEFIQGTGLGLSICKTLVSAMGGKIGVRSKLGEGSTFWITLPCNPNIDSQEASEEVHNELLHQEEELTSIERKKENIQPKKPKILIAEDNPSNYLYAKTVLSTQYDAERASDGFEALKMAKNNKYEFILMDMKMPNMDGLEATQKIREFDKKTPIIAISAYVLDTDQKDTIESGCNGFLTKPLKVDSLTAELSKLAK